MARTVRGRKGDTKKRAPKKAAPKAKVKAAVKKRAASPVRKVAAKSAMRKVMPKKATARTPAKKVVTRVPAARRTTVRRPRAASPPRRKVAAPRLKAATPAQRFAVSHLNEADYTRDGLRSYAFYRDLGIAAASGGLCQAHVIRLLSPCTDEVRKQHSHETELQLIYVLQGWVKNEFEGEGVHMMSAGSCWLQPPGIKHAVLDYSADAELLEIIVPADFKTIEVA
jgi:uncharacterized RmlC-like cupin family protein